MPFSATQIIGTATYKLLIHIYILSRRVAVCSKNKKHHYLCSNPSTTNVFVCNQQRTSLTPPHPTPPKPTSTNVIIPSYSLLNIIFRANQQRTSLTPPTPPPPPPPPPIPRIYKTPTTNIVTKPFLHSKNRAFFVKQRS